MLIKHGLFWVPAAVTLVVVILVVATLVVVTLVVVIPVIPVVATLVVVIPVVVIPVVVIPVIPVVAIPVAGLAILAILATLVAVGQHPILPRRIYGNFITYQVSTVVKGRRLAKLLMAVCLLLRRT
jgi:hypothetical protein